jgi:putative transposase
MMVKRRTEDLRRGRVSLAGARYFITICARRPESRLVHPPVGEAIASALGRIEKDGDATLMAYVIMPDHLHLLLVPSGRLPLGRVVGKLKALTEPAMRAGGLGWQANFFEHRLRPEDRAGDYARYIFLNPYRAGLICHSKVWPWWKRSEGYDFDLLAMLEEGRYPPHEWLELDLGALGVSPASVGSD